MSRFFPSQKASFGNAPGTLTFIGRKNDAPIQMEAFYFDEQECVEVSIDPKDALQNIEQEGKLLWLNVIGVHDTDFLTRLGTVFDLGDLLLARVANTSNRPGLEEYPGYLFFTLKMLQLHPEESVILSEQISMVMRENLVITFQERPGDVFDPIRERIRRKYGRIRKRGADYLAFAILDLLFDNYTLVVERLGDQIEEIEDGILTHPTPDILDEIHKFKRELNFLRKDIRPVRELSMQFTKLESPLVQESTRQFLRELNANAAQATEIIDSYGSMLSDFLQVYHTSISNKTNDVMKVLTVFTVIFIPLSFVAGIYGTNFDYIPETKFEYGYLYFWGLLVGIAALMAWYFKRKGWL